MLTINEPRVMWAWVCPITGMVLDEGWGSTRPYTVTKSTSYFGKRRIAQGEFRAVKVTIEPLNDAEQAVHEREYAEWRAKKDAEAAARGLKDAA